MRKPLVILGKLLVLVIVLFALCDRAFAAEKLTKVGINSGRLFIFERAQQFLQI